MDKITVAIPTYNRDDYLRQAISSVLEEKDLDLELLIVDTASPVNVKEIIDSFNDVRLKYIYYPENLGMVGAGNKCIELCTTKFLMLLADDDRLVKGGLKKLYDKLVIDDVAAAIGSVMTIDEAGQATGKMPVTDIDQCLDGKTFYRNYITGKIAVQPTAILLRTSALRKAGNYDGLIQYCPDMDLWLRVALHGKICLIADSCGDYRIHGGTATAKYRNNAEIGRSYRDLLKKQYTLAQVSGIFPQAELERMFQLAGDQFAGSCLAIGLDCLKNGREGVARQYFALAMQMTPNIKRKLLSLLLIAASPAGQLGYRFMKRLKKLCCG